MRKHNQGDKPDDDAANKPYSTGTEPPRDQIIPEKGEEYLREVANIEDMPSPAEDKEAENILRGEENRDQLGK
jgi:hypothetical protein